MGEGRTYHPVILLDVKSSRIDFDLLYWCKVWLCGSFAPVILKGGTQMKWILYL